MLKSDVLLNDDVLLKIYNYNIRNIPSVNRFTYNYKCKELNNYAKKIQKWYKKYKIENIKPILFIDDFYNNYYPKWKLIRYFMKFYPKKDLLDMPYYILRSKYRNIPIDLLNKWRYNINKDNNTCYEVFIFMKNSSISDLIKAGW